MPFYAKQRLPAEWEKQDAILIAWPHKLTDWAPQLSAAEQVFARIIREISHCESILLIVQQEKPVAQILSATGADLKNIFFHTLPCNDPWARDFGPLTILTEQGPVLLDFTFNGWGNKFDASLDNELTTKLHAAKAFGHTPLRSIPFVLEGGSIESDGEGTLLTSTACLLEKNRNPQLSQSEIETRLNLYFGCEKVLWLEQGTLQGDDTDSHIDTLARFAPNNSIIFQGCQDQKDSHFRPFATMHKQLAAFTSVHNKRYRLLELPWPQARYDQNGRRLPATYANFLIINNAVLVPTYCDPADQVALQVITRAFPHHKIIGIDCCSLIEQNGSLHCLTMQLPKGVLS